MAHSEVALAQQPLVRPSGALLGRSWALARRKPLGAISLAVLFAMALVVIGAEQIAPHTALDTFPEAILAGPSLAFPMGTDHVARDVLSRIIYGTRVTFVVALVSVVIGTALGTLLGVVSGYLEGKTDLAIQRVMDAQMAVPTLVLAMVLMAVLGPGMLNVILAIGLSLIPRIDRVVRASVLAEKRNVYVEAANAVGCSAGRIMLRHLLPNVTSGIIVMATVSVAQAIIIEASLSFLGIGVPAPEPSWGLMLGKETRKFMLAQPWLAVWPGLAISLAVLAWNMLGDALRDVWDPRLRGTQ